LSSEPKTFSAFDLKQAGGPKNHGNYRDLRLLMGGEIAQLTTRN